MKKKRRSGNSLGKMWLLTALLIIIFIAALIYLQKHNIKQTKHASHKPNKIITNNNSTKPRFDFYTVLPQNKHEPISSPVATIKTVQHNPSQNNFSKNTNNTKYSLQIAAVKNYADADRLKAELTLMGYTVQIQKVILNNIAWNRVSIGPYNSLNAAITAQTDLQKNKIKSILVKTK